MIIENGAYYVYVHINRINGKMYVGMSRRINPNERWKNGRGYNYNWHFYGAIKKYGWDNFDHEIVASHLTEAEASKMEQLLISALNTTDRKYGYNFAEGGYNNRALRGELNPLYGKVPTKAIEASAKKRTGTHLTEEHKQKISNGNKGKHNNPNSLKNLSDHYHDKRPYMVGSKNCRAHSVMCVETGVVYETMTAAAQAIGRSVSAVYQAMKQNIRAGGYHFTHVLNSNDQSQDVGSSESKWRDAESA